MFPLCHPCALLLSQPQHTLPGNRLSPRSWHRPCSEFSPYTAGGCWANPPPGTAQGRDGPGEQTAAFWGSTNSTASNSCSHKTTAHKTTLHTWSDFFSPSPNQNYYCLNCHHQQLSPANSRGKKGISEHSHSDSLLQKRSHIDYSFHIISKDN